MDSADVLIVGGGPAGSSCAWKLRQAGLQVVIVDKAAFPRDKVCAGWITPNVVTDLELDLRDYRQGRTLQTITGFRIGVIGVAQDVEISYDHPVSYGIRRCEFDHYLLQRSQATLRLGDAVRSIRHENGQWIVNDSVKAPLLIGAGGHFCPVARMLNPNQDDGPLVVAQEAEFQVSPSGWEELGIRGETPQLFFSRDLKGYGWCFRKREYVNIGLGRMNQSAFPRAIREFTSYLMTRGPFGAVLSHKWRGHAYLLSEPRCRRVKGEGVMLIGDAAGLAYPQSGEGIRSAIESGLLAAVAVLKAKRLRSDQSSWYEDRVVPRAHGVISSLLPKQMPAPLVAALGAPLLRWPWFARHIVINHGFLGGASIAATSV